MLRIVRIRETIVYVCICAEEYRQSERVVEPRNAMQIQ